MELAALGNVYFNDQAPWKLLKEGLSHRVEAVLFCACYCQKLLALISYPIIPGTAWEIWRMLSPKSLQLDSLDKDRVVDLWNRELLNFSEEVFSLTAPQLLFTIVD
ncbi:methionyl-tRNA synthetase [Chlamydia abortus]|nr:methionyl-tRNA synthetase [Chlamydia abortus]